MLDIHLRPLFDRALGALAQRAVSIGLSADATTLAAGAVGMTGALVIAAGYPIFGLLFFLFGRCLDGLDGAIARATVVTDRGGFLDIVLDFAVYAAIPLAFAVADPNANALAAAVLLTSYLLNGTAFLAYAILAAKRDLTTNAHGPKSLYYLSGLAEGTETILACSAFCLWPDCFAPLAYAFAAICTVSSIARYGRAWTDLK